MKRTFKTIGRFLLIMLLAVGSTSLLTACEDEGPMEEAGENIDEAAEEAGDNLEEATD
jgi:hypothetical protein